MKKLLEYKLKFVGTPEYYIGGDVGYNKGKVKCPFGAKTFIKNTTEKIEKWMEVKLNNYGSTMNTGDHPEVDDIDLFWYWYHHVSDAYFLCSVLNCFGKILCAVCN